MSDVLLDEQNLFDIADAIREKLGVLTQYLPSEMAEAIMNITGGDGIVYGGTNAPSSGMGHDEDIYVQYEEVDLTYKYAIIAIYRKVNGLWEVYVSPEYIAELAADIQINYSTGPYTYTAVTDGIVLAINSEEKHETTNITPITTITTTGEVLFTDTQSRSSASVPLVCGGTTVSVIRVSEGDTITFTNGQTGNATQCHVICGIALEVTGLSNEYWQDWRDNEWQSNTYTQALNNQKSYIAFLMQAANSRSVGTEITVDGDIEIISSGNQSDKYDYKVAFITNSTTIMMKTNNVTSYVGNQLALYEIGLSSAPTMVEAVHVYTQSTGGTDASVNIVKGTYDLSAQEFTATGEVINIPYQDARTRTTYYGMVSIAYGLVSSLYWDCRAESDNLTDGTTDFSNGDTISSWEYSVNKDLIIWKQTPVEGKIIYGTEAPSASQGNDGDYYYRRVKEPTVGVGYWDNRQNSNTSISGYRFTTTEECVVVGVRVYNRGNARTVTAGIYESNGTAIEEVTAEASASGWTTLMFEHSHTLQNATTYFSLANWGETGHAVYRSTYTIATDSRITSLVGAYNSTSNPSIDNDNVYGCDLLLENPNGDYYIITEQYVKENGSWVRLDG